LTNFGNIKINSLGTKKLRILLIEDDAIEVMKLKRAIAKLEMNHELIEAKNGEEALDILKDHTVLPDVIFLDLNMPKINGIEFLKILKKDEILRFLPTVMLTTSSNRKDILACYDTGVAGYIIKPLKYDHYVEKIKSALEYWSMNELIKA
jgi:CheY-like chemotaxis protein